MVDNRLAILMAERLVKITEISKVTGISRTTLTNLYYKRAKGISFNVLNELCEYFKCDICDLFEHKKSECA